MAKKYVDVDEFAEAICNFPAIDEHSANAVISLLRRQPTADVVEVVRCKDCKHCWHLVPDYTYPDRTDEVWECVRTIDWVDPDHFCSRGERRTDNDV